MSVLDFVILTLMVASALGLGFVLACIIFPLPDTDEIGRWAKEELDRRERKEDETG